MKDNNEILPKKEISYECMECGWQSMVKPKGMKCPDYCRGTVYKCEFRHPNQFIEKGVKTADQFSRLPWYEQIKYIPVAGALCSNGFQELTTKQLETYKNSKVTAAIRYKPQPANNDYAVKVIEERIKELEQIEVYGQVKLAYDATISELHNILKLLKK